MKKLLCALLSYFISISLFGQTPVENPWQEVKEANIQSFVDTRWIIPEKHRTYQLDRANFTAILSQANNSDNVTGLSQMITVPLPNGTIQNFLVQESSIMDIKLAEKFPEIKTYSGQGIDDPTAKIYLDLTPQGFHGMILSTAGTVFIDPYFRDDDNYYVSYYKKNFKPSESVTFSCEVIEDKDKLATEKQENRDQEVQLSSGARLASIQMRTYRIAIATSGEYTAFHGGTAALGLAAVTTALNRVRGVYEDELGVSFQLVANNNLIVYTDAATDPYPTGANPLNVNQAVIDNAIGSANYDVGHVFTLDSGGQAGLGVICNNSRKAVGYTGLPNPTGDPFYIDFVAHEIGHQFGGSHTFNGDSGSCSGGNRSGNQAYEPGSGSTIQAYAGICGNDNLQNNSDAYFHLVSLNQMRTHVTTGTGGNCGTLGAANNTTPVANADVENINGKSIPANTFFELTGSAMDADGDNLTYNWEQWDLGPQSDLNSPGANAPLFRSFEPTNNPTRTFPKLSAILSNSSSLGEQLPTGTRDLNFQFIARDDNSVGGYDADLVSLSVVGGSGPFKMNSPNAGGTFSGNTAVTWDVAGTTASPISCGQVDIYLSTDGGQTFGQLLVDDTPNDGSANVVLPEVNITTARLKIKCADNVFFDINDVNFTIQPSGNNNCAITNITAGATSTCDGMDNTYTQQVTVTFNDAPPSGNLVVNGQSFPLSSSPQTVTLLGLNSDGNPVNVTAAFSDNFVCSFTKNSVFTAPAPCVAEVCLTYNSTDTPIAISSSGTPTINSMLTINQAGKISNVKVKNLVGVHTYVRDLTMTLTSPAGTTITLFSGVCNFQNDFNLNFDDAGSAHNTIPCPPTDGGTYKPSTGTFASFNDQDANGTWTLKVVDGANDDGGSLNGWSLEICTKNEIDLPTVAFNSTSSNGVEPVSSTNIPVNLSTASASSIMVDYAITGTATGNGTDYTLTNGTLTFNAGSTTENITIASIVNDLLDETDETVILTLSNPVNASLGANTVHTYTINDNDTAPTIAFNNTNSDGLESISSANLQVDLATASAFSIMVDYAVTGTAGSGTDYTLANGTLTFNAGSTSENITIATIIDDAMDETNETVILTLSNPVNASLGTNTVHTYTINDNDDPPTVAFNTTSSNGSESLSSTNLQVDLAAASALSVTVDYTVTGTATGSGTDYTLTNGTLTFNAGSTSENITIANIIDDLLAENAETIILTLSNPVNASLGTNTIHTYTINDNDDNPTNCSLSSITLDQDPIPINMYVSGGTISSAGIVAINTNIGFQAKTSITLGVGFHAVEGSTFLAQIADCTPPSFQEIPSSTLRNLANNPLKNQQSITAVNIYPNPFAYTTTIAYQLSQATDLTIRLFDLSGKEVQRLLVGDKTTSGHHQLLLDGSQLPKGMYLLHFQTKERVITKKLVVQQ